MPPAIQRAGHGAVAAPRVAAWPLKARDPWLVPASLVEATKDARAPPNSPRHPSPPACPASPSRTSLRFRQRLPWGRGGKWTRREARGSGVAGGCARVHRHLCAGTRERPKRERPATRALRPTRAHGTSGESLAFDPILEGRHLPGAKGTSPNLSTRESSPSRESSPRESGCETSPPRKSRGLDASTASAHGLDVSSTTEAILRSLS